MAAWVFTFAGSVRINTPTTIGAMAVPSELNACASVSRAGALLSGPRIETYGFAEVCSPQTPVARTKLAVRKNGKLIIAAAGTKSRAPSTITNNEMTMVRL